MVARSSTLGTDRSVSFGKDCRSRPCVFPPRPRCHGLCGSQICIGSPVSIRSRSTPSSPPLIPGQGPPHRLRQGGDSRHPHPGRRWCGLSRDPTATGQRGLAGRCVALERRAQIRLVELHRRSRLPALAAAITARWVCEQAHPQFKQELDSDHVRGHSSIGLHRHALMPVSPVLAAAPPPRRATRNGVEDNAGSGFGTAAVVGPIGGRHAMGAPVRRLRHADPMPARQRTFRPPPACRPPGRTSHAAVTRTDPQLRHGARA